jgi:hypothetical protein
MSVVDVCVRVCVCVCVCIYIYILYIYIYIYIYLCACVRVCACLLLGEEYAADNQEQVYLCRYVLNILLYSTYIVHALIHTHTAV